MAIIWKGEKMSNYTMTTKELRIGNILNYCGQIVYVMGIYPDNKVELGYFADSIGFTRSIDDKDLKPIELSEETIIKLPFEKTDDYGDQIYYEPLGKGNRHYYICFDHDDISFGLSVFGNCTSLIYDNENLQFIHHFQNLYHSLTGEELTPITP
jgi:hypothetical protein